MTLFVAIICLVPSYFVSKIIGVVAGRFNLSVDLLVPCRRWCVLLFLEEGKGRAFFFSALAYYWDLS